MDKSLRSYSFQHKEIKLLSIDYLIYSNHLEVTTDGNKIKAWNWLK